jgi:DNA-binding transcriptional MerR regulator
MMSSGECARRLGVSVSVLRLWEHKGFVAPQRTSAGWRVYDESDVERLQEQLRKKNLKRTSSSLSVEYIANRRD